MNNFEFIFALNRAVNVFNNYIDTHITPNTGVSRAQYIALMLIERFPNITNSTLARKLSCSHVASGRLVTILVAKGYIESEPDRQNPHASCLHVTHAGGKVVAEVKDIFEEKTTTLFAGIKDDFDVDLLSTQLTTFTEAVLGLLA